MSAALTWECPALHPCLPTSNGWAGAPGAAGSEGPGRPSRDVGTRPHRLPRPDPVPRAWPRPRVATALHRRPVGWPPPGGGKGAEQTRAPGPENVETGDVEEPTAFSRQGLTTRTLWRLPTMDMGVAAGPWATLRPRRGTLAPRPPPCPARRRSLCCYLPEAWLSLRRPPPPPQLLPKPHRRALSSLRPVRPPRCPVRQPVPCGAAVPEPRAGRPVVHVCLCRGVLSVASRPGACCATHDTIQSGHGLLRLPPVSASRPSVGRVGPARPRGPNTQGHSTPTGPITPRRPAPGGCPRRWGSGTQMGACPPQQAESGGSGGVA